MIRNLPNFADILESNRKRARNCTPEQGSLRPSILRHCRRSIYTKPQQQFQLLNRKLNLFYCFRARF
uniref:Uncharacterized protein n=1 Tax=Rhizophora mucronata TaxID=61149 RepID=A0A2P2JX11_RHIMU